MQARSSVLNLALAAALAASGLVISPSLALGGSALDPFVGRWAGNAVSSSVDSFPRLNSRDLDIVIEKTDNGGLTITSAFVQLSAGEETRRSRTLEFEPSDKAGIWQAQDGCDPFMGAICGWARISADSLIVTLFGFDEDGRSELQVFDRTVTDSRMKLAFRRAVDGRIKRTVTGNLLEANDELTYAQIVEAGLLRDIEATKNRDNQAAAHKAVAARALAEARAALAAFRAKTAQSD